jgi:hypothetical protein
MVRRGSGVSGSVRGRASRTVVVLWCAGADDDRRRWVR